MKSGLQKINLRSNNFVLHLLCLSSNQLLNNMGSLQAIEKLEESNRSLQITLEQLGEQFEDLRHDPRFEGLVDDLENLAVNYLKTWMNSNKQVIELLEKR